MVYINLYKLQRYIQKNAHRYFPARELWMTDNGTFWAYEEDGRCLYITDGIIVNRRIVYRTISHCGEDIQTVLDRVLEEKVRQGYECFATLG